MNRKVSPKLVALSFGVLILLFLISFYALSWTEPSQAPPGGNVPAPLNVGSASQYKSGALGIGGILRGYAGAIFDGNVGIGTAGPGSKLHVVGDTRIESGALRFASTDKGLTELTAANDPYGHGAFRLNVHPWDYAANLHIYNLLDGSVPFMLNIKGNSWLNGGNVGIGTTNPSQKLDVAGYVKGQSGLCMGNDCRSSWPSTGTTISGYCIQCWHSRFGWGNEACASFGNWTGLSYFGDDNNDMTGCRIRIY